MVKFEDLDYTDDLKVIDMIKRIQEVFVLIITSFIKKYLKIMNMIETYLDKW